MRKVIRLESEIKKIFCEITLELKLFLCLYSTNILLEIHFRLTHLPSQIIKF